MKTILNLSLPICLAETQSLRAANPLTPGKLFGLTIALAWSCLAATSPAQLSPEWVSRVPVGTSLSAGTAGIYVDPDGVSYITGTSGLRPTPTSRPFHLRQTDRPGGRRRGTARNRCGPRKRNHERIERRSLCGREYTPVPISSPIS